MTWSINASGTKAAASNTITELVAPTGLDAGDFERTRTLALATIEGAPGDAISVAANGHVCAEHSLINLTITSSTTKEDRNG